ncbi:MAG TPA: UDP-N-acetylmuramoyl-L-alanyl-D-glutamate--2,6-diaminopimelate ligase [bacterium]
MKVNELLDGEILRIYGLNGDEAVADVTANSRSIIKKSLFFAMKGLKFDGRSFLADAVKKGALAGVVDRIKEDSVPQIEVKDVRKAFGIAVSRITDNPSMKMLVIGVTGTNGKTTITYLLGSILREAGINAGIMGTTGVIFSGKLFPAELTTPDAKILNHYLLKMLESNVKASVMEVSSHAIDLERVWGINFDAGIFTNLTHDHLDYHTTMESYFRAKERFFTECLQFSRKGDRIAVINIDDEFGRRINPAPGIRMRCYGRDPRAEVRILDAEISPGGSIVYVLIDGKREEFIVNLFGEHNVYNAAACVALASAIGIDTESIKSGISNVRSIPGRLEPIANSLGIRILIDYAHTPDALKNALNSVRRITAGRIITVFGCGGDRDKGKRPLMGGISGALSNYTIITSDNPRSEQPESIIYEIEQGLRGLLKAESENALAAGKKAYLVIPDRSDAIRLAIRIAREGDSILIAGKGHEDYQIIGNKRLHFSDREEVEVYLREIGGAP